MTIKRISALWLTLIFLMSGSLLSLQAAPPTQGSDYDIPGGHFFTQTANGQGGFSVLDDGEARFWSEFQRLGGLQTVGYPISRRYVQDGFVIQAFQKLILQWRADVGQAWPVNVFDELSRSGFNQILFETRQTPYPLSDFDPPNGSWQEIVAARQGLLDTNEAIGARYFSVSDPLNVFGLPTSQVADMGNHFAMRTQRAVFQQWKEDVPWASQGEVTIANGGDIAKELGWLPTSALQPEPEEPEATQEWGIDDLLVGPGRLYALQWASSEEKRLLQSDDFGDSWQSFSGSLPACTHALDMDYAQLDALYASTCNGLYVWSGNGWELRSDTELREVAVAFDQPNTILGISSDGVLRSDDGGRSWQTINAAGYTPSGVISHIGIDPRDNNIWYGIRPYTNNLVRGTLEGESQHMPSPNGYLNRDTTIDGRTGDLYLTTDSTLWHSSNPREADVDQVRWEKVHQFDSDWLVNLVGSSHRANELVLFATVDIRSAPLSGQQLYRSLDGGHSWHLLSMPN